MVNARNASLPMEVVEEILLKLPVKSLKRFRCVCRSWLSSIDSPDFVKMHYRNSHNLSALVTSVPDLASPLVEEEKAQLSLLCSETMSVREKLHIPFFEIIGESQGLVLLVHDSRAGLLNPATKEFKLIPESTLFRTNSYRSYIWGFGYDGNSHDYKILRYCSQLLEAKKMLIELYTLSTNSWREICYPLEIESGPLHNRFESCVYVNGRCHWWLNGLRNTIIAFDMAEENFHLMDFPLSEAFNPALCRLELRVFSNCLAFSNQKNIGKHYLFEIWVMKDYEVKDSWTKQLVFGPIPEFMHLLGMWKTGEWFFATINNRLALYNPENMVVKYLEMRSYRHIYPIFQSAVYTENLFSLNGTYLNPMYDEDNPRRMDSLEEAARNI